MTPRAVVTALRRDTGEGNGAPVVPASSPAPLSRSARWRRAAWGSVLALGSLLYIFGVAVLTMVAGGVVLHAISPQRSLDVFSALHKQVVVGVLLGLAVFWLLPPHPWMKETDDHEARPPAGTVGETEHGGADKVAVLGTYRGRDPSLRPTAEGR